MEKAHDISLDEPCVAHQAILFMLDVLMRNNKPTMALAELYDSFGDKSFTPQMLRAVGGNEQGLKQFLLRYPSLFTVNGDSISANSGGNQLPRTSTTPERYLRKTKSKGADSGVEGGISSSSSADLINSSSSSSSSSSTSSSSSGVNGNSSSGVGSEQQHESKTMKEIEQEAIAFFRKQMAKREEDWLQIVSVAGHASQSSADVRKFVGPQNEFKQFLQKYPHIFIVRDDYCGLKGRADVSSTPFPPPSPPPKRRIQPTINGAVLTRNHSFKNTNRYSACGNLMPNATAGLTTSALINNQSIVAAPNGIISNPNTTITNSNTVNPTTGMAKPRLTPVEVKAVHYVMRILHKNGRMLLQTIPGLISRAPDQVSNIVGFTREDLIQFFKRHSAIFQLHPDGCVSVKQDAVKALILKDGSSGNGTVNGAGGSAGSDSPGGMITGSGVVLRIFPKYGILNMDNNEQVFFDIQSCQFETFSDLTTILHTGDRLHFNGVIGPRDGSTKWRSLKTWIKMKPQQSSSNNMICMLDNMSSHSDADKSDDSSTSSSHGGYGGSGRHHSHHHGHHHQNGYAGSNQVFYQNSNTNGHYYIASGTGSGGQTTPTQSMAALASSPNGISGSNMNSLNNSLSSAGMHQSNPNLSLDDSGNNNLNGGIGLSNSGSALGANLNGTNGDFNQYQLDAGDFTQTTNNSNGDDGSNEPVPSTSPSLSNHSSNLIHSSSANNLQLLQNNSSSNNVQTISPLTTNTKTNSLTTSKSIHSFNLSSPESNQSIEQQFSSLQLNSSSSSSSSGSSKKADNDNNKSTNGTTNNNNNNNNSNSVTKFMKQAPDNISQREVSSTNSEMISIGCQTISTGDITVTNVYIE